MIPPARVPFTGGSRPNLEIPPSIDILSQITPVLRAQLALVLTAERSQDYARLQAVWVEVAQDALEDSSAMRAAATEPVAMVAAEGQAHSERKKNGFVEQQGESDEILFDMLCRHAVSAAHGGVRRVAMYLMSVAFTANEVLQGQVLLHTNNEQPPVLGGGRSVERQQVTSFCWRSWWVVLVPRACHRNWEANRHARQLDRRYDVEICDGDDEHEGGVGDGHLDVEDVEERAGDEKRERGVLTGGGKKVKRRRRKTVLRNVPREGLRVPPPPTATTSPSKSRSAAREEKSASLRSQPEHGLVSLNGQRQDDGPLRWFQAPAAPSMPRLDGGGGEEDRASLLRTNAPVACGVCDVVDLADDDDNNNGNVGGGDDGDSKVCGGSGRVLRLSTRQPRPVPAPFGTTGTTVVAAFPTQTAQPHGSPSPYKSTTSRHRQAQADTLGGKDVPRPSAAGGGGGNSSLDIWFDAVFHLGVTAAVPVLREKAFQALTKAVKQHEEFLEGSHDNNNKASSDNAGGKGALSSSHLRQQAAGSGAATALSSCSTPDLRALLFPPQPVVSTRRKEGGGSSSSSSSAADFPEEKLIGLEEFRQLIRGHPLLSVAPSGGVSDSVSDAQLATIFDTLLGACQTRHHELLQRAAGAANGAKAAAGAAAGRRRSNSGSIREWTSHLVEKAGVGNAAAPRVPWGIDQESVLKLLNFGRGNYNHINGDEANGIGHSGGGGGGGGVGQRRVSMAETKRKATLRKERAKEDDDDDEDGGGGGDVETSRRSGRWGDVRLACRLEMLRADLHDSLSVKVSEWRTRQRQQRRRRRRTEKAEAAAAGAGDGTDGAPESKSTTSHVYDSGGDDKEGDNDDDDDFDGGSCGGDEKVAHDLQVAVAPIHIHAMNKATPSDDGHGAAMDDGRTRIGSSSSPRSPMANTTAPTQNAARLFCWPPVATKTTATKGPATQNMPTLSAAAEAGEGEEEEDSSSSSSSSSRSKQTMAQLLASLPDPRFHLVALPLASCFLPKQQHKRHRHRVIGEQNSPRMRGREGGGTANSDDCEDAGKTSPRSSPRSSVLSLPSPSSPLLSSPLLSVIKEPVSVASIFASLQVSTPLQAPSSLHPGDGQKRKQLTHHHSHYTPTRKEQALQQIERQRQRRRLIRRASHLHSLHRVFLSLCSAEAEDNQSVNNPNQDQDSGGGGGCGSGGWLSPLATQGQRLCVVSAGGLVADSTFKRWARRQEKILGFAPPQHKHGNENEAEAGAAAGGDGDSDDGFPPQPHQRGQHRRRQQELELEQQRELKKVARLTLSQWRAAEEEVNRTSHKKRVLRKLEAHKAQNHNFGMLPKSFGLARSLEASEEARRAALQVPGSASAEREKSAAAAPFVSVSWEQLVLVESAAASAQAVKVAKREQQRRAQAKAAAAAKKQRLAQQLTQHQMSAGMTTELALLETAGGKQEPHKHKVKRRRQTKDVGSYFENWSEVSTAVPPAASSMAATSNKKKVSNIGLGVDEDATAQQKGVSPRHTQGRRGSVRGDSTAPLDPQMEESNTNNDSAARELVLFNGLVVLDAAAAVAALPSTSPLSSSSGVEEASPSSTAVAGAASAAFSGAVVAHLAGLATAAALKCAKTHELEETEAQENAEGDDDDDDDEGDGDLEFDGGAATGGGGKATATPPPPHLSKKKSKASVRSAMSSNELSAYERDAHHRLVAAHLHRFAEQSQAAQAKAEAKFANTTRVTEKEETSSRTIEHRRLHGLVAAAAATNCVNADDDDDDDKENETSATEVTTAASSGEQGKQEERGGAATADDEENDYTDDDDDRDGEGESEVDTPSNNQPINGDTAAAAAAAGTIRIGARSSRQKPLLQHRPVPVVLTVSLVQLQESEPGRRRRSGRSELALVLRAHPLKPKNQNRNAKKASQTRLASAATGTSSRSRLDEWVPSSSSSSSSSAAVSMPVGMRGVLTAQRTEQTADAETDDNGDEDDAGHDDEEDDVDPLSSSVLRSGREVALRLEHFYGSSVLRTVRAPTRNEKHGRSMSGQKAGTKTALTATSPPPLFEVTVPLCFGDLVEPSQAKGMSLLSPETGGVGRSGLLGTKKRRVDNEPCCVWELVQKCFPLERMAMIAAMIGDDDDDDGNGNEDSTSRYGAAAGKQGVTNGRAAAVAAEDEEEDGQGRGRRNGGGLNADIADEVSSRHLMNEDAFQDAEKRLNNERQRRLRKEQHNVFEEEEVEEHGGEGGEEGGDVLMDSSLVQKLVRRFFVLPAIDSGQWLQTFDTSHSPTSTTPSSNSFTPPSPRVNLFDGCAVSPLLLVQQSSSSSSSTTSSSSARLVGEGTVVVNLLSSSSSPVAASATYARIAFCVRLLITTTAATPSPILVAAQCRGLVGEALQAASTALVGGATHRGSDDHVDGGGNSDDEHGGGGSRHRRDEGSFRESRVVLERKLERTRELLRWSLAVVTRALTTAKGSSGDRGKGGAGGRGRWLRVAEDPTRKKGGTAQGNDGVGDKEEPRGRVGLLSASSSSASSSVSVSLGERKRMEKPLRSLRRRLQTLLKDLALLRVLEAARVATGRHPGNGLGSSNGVGGGGGGGISMPLRALRLVEDSLSSAMKEELNLNLWPFSGTNGTTTRTRGVTAGPKDGDNAVATKSGGASGDLLIEGGGDDDKMTNALTVVGDEPNHNALTVASLPLPLPPSSLSPLSPCVALRVTLGADPSEDLVEKGQQHTSVEYSSSLLSSSEPAAEKRRRVLEERARRKEWALFASLGFEVNTIRGEQRRQLLAAKDRDRSSRQAAMTAAAAAAGGTVVNHNDRGGGGKSGLSFSKALRFHDNEARRKEFGLVATDVDATTGGRRAGTTETSGSRRNKRQEGCRKGGASSSSLSKGALWLEDREKYLAERRKRGGGNNEVQDAR